MDQELDVRKYVVAVASRWKWLLACAVLAALAAFTYSMLLPKTYTATASVLLFVRQTGSQLGTNEPILSVETIDAGARRQGLIAFARSEAIEAALPEDVLQRIVPVNYRRGMLVQNKTITVSSDGDLLNITAKAQTPEQAQELANTWAESYVSEVTRLYQDQHSTIQRAGAALLPLKPSAPKIASTTLTGGTVGLLVGVLAVLVTTVAGSSFALPRWPRKRGEQATTRPSPTR